MLQAIAAALTGARVDYRTLEPLGPTGSPTCSPRKDLDYRQRIVHHMVLGELVLRPIPVVVAHRVAKYAEALGVRDDFVRVARRYAQGAYGLAWMDLQRSGFVEHVREAERGSRRSTSCRTRPSAREVTPSSRRDGRRSSSSRRDTLGYGVWDMYDSRGFGFPGRPGGAACRTAPATTSCTCSPTTAPT